MNSGWGIWLRLLPSAVIVLVLLGCTTQSVYVVVVKQPLPSEGYIPMCPDSTVEPLEDNYVLLEGAEVLPGAIPIEEENPPARPLPKPLISVMDKHRLQQRITQALSPGWSVSEVHNCAYLARLLEPAPPFCLRLQNETGNFCDLLIYPQEFEDVVITPTPARTPSFKYLGRDGHFLYLCYPKDKGEHLVIFDLRNRLNLSW